MIFYSALFTGIFFFALILRIKRHLFYEVAESSVALVDNLLSDQEDEVKIKLVQKGTGKLVGSLLKMFLVALSAGVIGSIPVVLYCIISRTGYQELEFGSFYSIMSLSLGATIPFLLPVGKKTKSDYSELAQLLHRMALNNYYIANRLFNRELKKIRKRGVERRPDFIIVSGLARAGTTSMMNDLSRMEGFVSLTYANMPFLMCPNTWTRIYRPKKEALKERSHKDGILIGLDSNEALEEFFFKVITKDSYIHDHHLSEHEISEEAYSNYLDYQSIIKLDNSKIYLAKNNNFLLRYRSMREQNDSFIQVIMYRDPLFHAASLMEKHKAFTELQESDPFVLEYMDWLGHHEFGLNQKSFVFSNSEEIRYNNKMKLDYWLFVWNNYYKYALTISHPNTLFINYEAYCNDPIQTIGTILERAGITADPPQCHPFTNKRTVTQSCSDLLLKQAREIYDQLKQR